MSYQAIIFDLDNTLLNFELCERQAILGALSDCAVSYALSKLDLTPAQVLYVGDSLSHDYAGTTQVNIDFCYYNRKNQALPQEVKPKFIVTQLLNLLELVK